VTKIAVLDDWQGIAADAADWSAVRARAEVTFFHDAFPNEDAVVSSLADYDIVLAMRERSRLMKPVIDRLPKLKLLCFTGARNASVDVAACTARGITVCNTVSSRTSHATAELALALLLAAARRIPLGDAETRAGRFQRNVPPGIEMFGRTLGIIGLGHIGGRVASYAKALGMNVIAWSQNLTGERAREVGVTKVAKDELLGRADAVTIHLVLSDRTRGLIGAAELAKMKRGAILVNTSRGPIVDTAALVAALNEGKIIAALDVYDQEPLPAGHPLLSAPNTLLTPHLGYVTQDGMTDFYKLLIEDVLAWLAGSPIRVVNPETVSSRKA
jgi:phosphoglycerate dehydrogenase-like enzyme